MDLTPEQMRWIVQAMIILVLSICVHEFGHAYIADKLGDSLPRSQGRVTLNPLAHADPIGTLAFPLIGLIYTGGLGFGWGKPVEVRPVRFSRKYPMRVGHMFVAFAGPLMNLLFGTFLCLLHVGLVAFDVLPGTPHVEGLDKALWYAVHLNFTLFFFNLIPAPPLDGGAVTEGLLPSKWLPAFRQYSVYGPFVLMVVILVPGMHKVFTVPAGIVRDGMYDLSKMIFGMS